MTRQEFMDDIADMGDLTSFCWENSCNLLEEVYDRDLFNDYIDTEVCEYARSNTWQEVRDWLESLPDPCGGDYLYCSYGEWYIVDDDDFNEYKSDVFDWAEENDLFEEEEIEEEVEEDDEYIDDFDEASLTDVVFESHTKTTITFNLSNEAISAEILL